jgi:hypothetical protein
MVSYYYASFKNLHAKMYILRQQPPPLCCRLFMRDKKI